jgi:hypothetical protein
LIHVAYSVVKFQWKVPNYFSWQADIYLYYNISIVVHLNIRFDYIDICENILECVLLSSISILCGLILYWYMWEHTLMCIIKFYHEK